MDESMAQRSTSFTKAGGFCWNRVVAGCALATIGSLAGCSAWVPGVEVRFYTPSSEHSESPAPAEYGDVAVETANFTPAMALKIAGASQLSSTWDGSHDRNLNGAPDGHFTRYSLIPGEYEFEFQMKDEVRPVYGEIKVSGPSSMRARNFIHHTFVVVNPRNGRDGLGSGFSSVVTEDDLRRAEMGDVVEKVVFVADLQAVEGRIAAIDEEVRRLQDEEARLAGQIEYWGVKANNRRLNALYDAGYGEDTPAIHLAGAQLLIGAEAYHWKRYSEADDRMRTYEEKLATLRLPAERLREERVALRALLGNVRILHRSGDMMLATSDMTRRYHDPVDEISEKRRTLRGPEMGLDAPYWFSEVAHVLHWPHLFSGLAIYPRLIDTRNRMETNCEPIGEVLMVIRIGPRPLRRFR
jgi:hypothetical protein